MEYKVWPLGFIEFFAKLIIILQKTPWNPGGRSLYSMNYTYI